MSVDDITPGEDKELFRRAIGFLHQARPLCGLTPAAFARVEHKLEQPAAKSRRRSLLLAAATLCLLLVAGTAFAVVNDGLAHLPIVGPWFAPKPSEPDRPAKPRRAHVPAKPAPMAPQGAVVPSAAPTESSVLGGNAVVTLPPAALAAAPSKEGAEIPTVGAKHAPASQRKVALIDPTSAPAAPAAFAPAPAANPILDESRSFSAAIGHWHRERDASAALAALDEHDRGFSGGHLQIESRLLRAEILLAQGRERESLALLDQVTLAGSPRARELFTVRGELRIKFGRCREGRADLDEVLAKGMADAFARRAAEAIAHCP